MTIFGLFKGEIIKYLANKPPNYNKDPTSDRKTLNPRIISSDEYHWWMVNLKLDGENSIVNCDGGGDIIKDCSECRWYRFILEHGESSCFFNDATKHATREKLIKNFKERLRNNFLDDTPD
jgi:hypothetical protein